MSESSKGDAHDEPTTSAAEVSKSSSVWRKLGDALLTPLWIVGLLLVLGAMGAVVVVIGIVGQILAAGMLVWLACLGVRDYVRAFRKDWRSTLWSTGVVILATVGVVIVILIVGAMFSGSPRECIETRYYSTC